MAALAAFLFATSCAASEPIEQKIDRILVEKQARQLALLSNGEVVRSYAVSLGGNPVGHKQQEGDERTPEGVYSISARNPNSAFHRSLQISYPSDRDKAAAATQGVDPGGLIMIHGIRNGLGWLGPLHRFVDWTDGCIAVTNAEMDEIWQSVSIGTPVEIKP
jgi:murein L,D-transpeptidase YafK